MRLIDTTAKELDLASGAGTENAGQHTQRVLEERAAQTPSEIPAAEQQAAKSPTVAAAEEARFQELLRKATNGPEMGYGWGTSGPVRVSGGGWGDR